MEGKNGNKKEYSLQLLNCATEKSSVNAVVLFGESDAESRIKNILSYSNNQIQYPTILFYIIPILISIVVLLISNFSIIGYIISYLTIFITNYIITQV